MVAEDDPPSLSEEQLDNIQGDIWSKGFPKYYETYYFFAIKPGNAKLFAQSLKDLVTQSPPLISTLRKVKKDQDCIRERKEQAAAVAKKLGIPEKDEPLLPTANALIAFTYKGLEIQARVAKDSLDLELLGITDPAFFKGMASEKVRTKLSDPAPTTWDSLFRSPQIHGMLKIAGSSKDEVERHLTMIQKVLKHGTAIEDAFQKDESPKETDSRVDGWTRPNDRGKEHFGFEDGVSQPLMGGIDKFERSGPPNMNTDPNIIIVTSTTHHEGETERPDWMHDGSFIVFRKLEQNVEGFEALTDQWQNYKCASKAHMGAKLVGRWQSGAPIVKFPDKDTKDPKNDKLINDFVYANQICPISAHIRKTNIREIVGNNDPDPRAKRTRIIRSGITYGPDYKGHEKEKRGLLFACYQGAIEDGFENMQSSWSNKITFRSGTPGHDPIIGQDPSGNLKTEITDTNGNPAGNVAFQQLVTLKGGEYFFAPSIKALRIYLSDVSS